MVVSNVYNDDRKLWISMRLTYYKSKRVGVDFVTGGLHDMGATVPAGYVLEMKTNRFDKNVVIDALRGAVKEATGNNPAVLPTTYGSGLTEFRFDSVLSSNQIMQKLSMAMEQVVCAPHSVHTNSLNPSALDTKDLAEEVARAAQRRRAERAPKVVTEQARPNTEPVAPASQPAEPKKKAGDALPTVTNAEGLVAERRVAEICRESKEVEMEIQKLEAELKRLRSRTMIYEGRKEDALHVRIEELRRQQQELSRRDEAHQARKAEGRKSILDRLRGR